MADPSCHPLPSNAGSGAHDRARNAHGHSARNGPGGYRGRIDAVPCFHVDDSRGSRLLTKEDVADRWQCRPRQVREMWARRELPAVKVGRLVRFRLEDIEAYEAARSVSAGRGPLAGGAA